ncbi:MAG: hypothetical protein KF729_31905 [Sandaracinaceae bacterium]|nr:hypothetical protein [Sandaracinaceae bacterium]
MSGAPRDSLPDADLRAAEPSAIVKLAAAVQGVTGLLVALTGLQVIDVTWRADWANWVPRLLIVLGVGAIGLAAMQYRARRWAAFASGANGIVVALAVLGWLFYTLTSVLSCLMYFTVPLSALSALLSLLAIGPILKTAAARQRLADAGLSLGL